MPDQVYGNVVGDDLVNEGRVVNGPACFSLAEGIAELALRGSIFPSLPNVCGCLGVDIVGELVLELLAERLLRQDIHADLRLWLLWRRFGRVEGLFRLRSLLGRLLRLFLLFEFGLPRGRPWHVVRVAEIRC